MLALLPPTGQGDGRARRCRRGRGFPIRSSPPSVEACQTVPKLSEPLPPVSSVLFWTCLGIGQLQGAAAEERVAAEGVGIGEDQRAAVGLDQAAGPGQRPAMV